MLKFLNSFSAPLIGSLSFWPFLCILLTIPFIISRLIMRRRVTWSYVFFSYGSILYFTGLIFFTLSPVPKDPIAFCQTYHIQPQLIPFNWVNDVVQPNKDTLYITLQRAAGHFYESVFSQALEICVAKRLSFIDANRSDAANWRVRFISLQLSVV